MSTVAQQPSLDGVEHPTAHVNGTRLHYVSAGVDGSPILLVHGFPETWWAFHEVIPLLAATHRVYAVDLRGFGDSAAIGAVESVEGAPYPSVTAAEDLHQLIEHLGVGPVHLTGQDISGAAVVRLAAAHPQDVRSLTAVEMGLAGYGLEALGDVTRGGSWHIGVLAAPGIPELLLAGRARELLGDWAFPAMTAVPGAVREADVDEFTRSYSRPGGWRGATALYRSMLTEGDDLRRLLEATPVAVPVLAIGAGGGPFTHATMRQVVSGALESIQLDGVGHYVALEAPAALAATIDAFVTVVDAG